jgi:predicted ATP-grasp superfamily ATP-dependent carboligase
MDVAREVGVPVPREIAVDDPTTGCGEAVRFASEVGWPVVLKPHRSAVTGLSGIEKFGVRIVTDQPSLVDGLAGYPADAFPVLVQERIQGPGLGAFFLAIRGEVIASFAHRRIREKPPTGGVSVVRDSVPLRDDVGRYSEALLGRFGWSGVAMVEFKEDAATGIPYLMEINGRFWGSLQLAIDAGVDFPTLLLGNFDEGGASPSAGSFRSGVRSRWFWGDVDHLLWILRAPSGYRETNPELPGRMSAILRFLLPWRPGLKYEVLRLSDLRPFLRESRQWIAQVTSPG